MWPGNGGSMESSAMRTGKRNSLNCRTHQAKRIIAIARVMIPQYVRFFAAPTSPKITRLTLDTHIRDLLP